MRLCWGFLTILIFTLSSLPLTGEPTQHPARGDRGQNEKSSSPLPNQKTEQPGTPGDDFNKGYKAGLSEYEGILREVRQELDDARKETERAKFANDIFIAIYGGIALFLGGSGIFSLRRQRRDTEKAARIARRAALQAHAERGKVREVIAQSAAEMGRILETRKSLFSELPSYLKRTVSVAEKMDPKYLDPFQQALIHEIDHLTFLGNPSFRFRRPETPDEITVYSQSLLLTTRGHLAKAQPVEALARVDMLFELAQSGTKISDKDIARAYGYRAYAYLLLVEREERTSVLTLERAAQVKEWRQHILEALRQSSQLNPSWSYPYFLEALYYSLYASPPDGATDKAKRRMEFTAGQKSAIDLYRKLIAEFATLKPSQVPFARQNICCCLKRLGDVEGNYDPLFQELSHLPSEADIRMKTMYDQNSVDQGSERLWRVIAEDRTFFEKLTGDPQQDASLAGPYKDRWVAVFASKMESDWRTQYSDFAIRHPSVQQWRIRYWE